MDAGVHNDDRAMAARRRAYYNSGAPYTMIRAAIVSAVFALINLAQLIVILVIQDSYGPNTQRNVSIIFIAVNTVFVGLLVVMRAIVAFAFPIRHAMWTHLYAYDRNITTRITIGAFVNVLIFFIAFIFARTKPTAGLGVCVWSAANIIVCLEAVYKIGGMLYLE